jgi:hypothetical protein
MAAANTMTKIIGTASAGNSGVVAVVVAAPAAPPYCRTLLLAESATQRWPAESNARLVGLLRPIEDVVAPLAVKLAWPITRLAAS